MTIYELRDALIELENEAEHGDLDPQILRDTFEGLDGAIEDKAEAWAKMMQTLEGYEKALELEEKRLSERRNTMKKNRERMKEQLSNVLQSVGKTKFKTALFNFYFKRSTSTWVDETADLPEWALVPQKPKISKTVIKEHLQNGEEYEWARLEENYSLQIK